MVWWHFPAFQAASELVKNLGSDVVTNEVKNAVKRTREDNPREDLGYVFSQLDLITRENVRAYGISDIAEAYPRLHTMSTNSIGRVARNILDQRYETWYQHRPNENDFATCLGNAIRRKPGEEKTIDMPETIKLFLYYADQEDNSFLRSMERLKHDPFAHQIRYYAQGSIKAIYGAVSELWEKVRGTGDVSKLKNEITQWMKEDESLTDKERGQKELWRQKRRQSIEKFRKGGFKSWFRF